MEDDKILDEEDFQALGLALPDILESSNKDISKLLEEEEDEDEDEEEYSESDYISGDNDSSGSESSSSGNSSDEEDNSEKINHVLNNSINISLPKKEQSKTNKSVLSQKKFVSIKDKFDVTNFNELIKNKKTTKKKSNKDEDDEDDEPNEMDTDEDEVNNNNNNNNKDNSKDNSIDNNIDNNNNDNDNNNSTTTTTTTTTTTKKRNKKSNKKNQNSQLRLPKSIRDLLAKGNEYYLKDKFEDANIIYAEIIRLMPRLTAPYNILGKIREHQGRYQEALSFYVLGAQIQGTNGELWASIGHKAKHMGNIETALYCFTRAARVDEKDYDSLWERIQILNSQGQGKKALTSLLKLNSLRPHDPQVLVELANVYSSLGQYHDAVTLISPIVKEQLSSDTPIEQVSLDTVNLVMELNNKTRSFADTILIYNKVSTKIGSENQVPIDLLFNVCVAYFSLGTEGGTDRGTRLLNSRLLPSEPEQLADLFNDLGEQLYQLGRYNEALQTFQRLKDTPFDQPSVWVKIAECYRYQKNLESAIEYLAKANKQVPDNVNVTIAMSEIYKEMGDEEKALQILNQSSTFSNKNDQTEKEIFTNTLKEMELKRDTITTEEVKMYYRHAEAFLNLSKYSQFLGITTALLYGSNDKCFFRRKVTVGLFKKRKRSIKEKSKYLGTPFAQLLDEEDYFNLLVETSKVLSHFNRHQEASQYLRYALRNVKFENTLFSHQLKFIAVGVAFSDKNYYLAFKYVKYVCSKKPYDNRVWNLFNKIIVNYGSRSTVQSRFLSKIYEKYPNSLPVLVMIGNQNKQTDNVRGALFEYIKAYRISPDDPLINLLIGVLILSQVMGRKQANRHKMTVIAYSFIFKYANLRGECQETNYNIGRAFHQLGIYNMAINFYNKVLDSKDECDENGNIDKDQSLKCESAFNLSLIYKTRGNVNLANQILKKYIVI